MQTGEGFSSYCCEYPVFTMEQIVLGSGAALRMTNRRLRTQKHVQKCGIQTC